MAEIAGSFVGAAIEAMKWVGEPIIRQFNYLFCFTTNITSLKLEAEKLDDAAGDLQGKVDRARDNVRIIAREVDTWLKTSKDMKDEINGILNEVTNLESGCLKLGARFSLSRRAKKTTDRMKDLRGQCKFDAISQPGPPTAMRVAPIGRMYEFESRKQIEEDIMTCLKDGDVNMIGICGMGGLGKTTMAKMIMNRALKEHVFEEVVMAVVSQQVDKLKIQVEIGGPLGLKKLQEDASLANRVQKLHSRLTAGTKRILLVLDDVWERLELEEIGIPCGCKGCTILLTSRNSDVLNAMNVQKVFGMKVLFEEEAWFLFRERAGTCVNDTQLNSLVKQVVKECSGLPIALITVGAALKDEKNASIWKDALRQLRQCDPDIPDFIAKVYNPLKLSYDALGSKHAKFVFLLCCLFGEDADIPVEKLTYFCMGLCIFEGGIKNMEEARNRMCALTKMLKSRSLLLDGLRDEDDVRMHDVVRDVCIFIAKQEGYIFHNDCTWTSSSLQLVGERPKFPTNLRLLFLSGNLELKLDSSILEKGIRNLQVLCIQYYSLTSLPQTTQSLRNLNTLVFHFCPGLETISVVGELVNLEILTCCNCWSIEELPQEIKGLNRLKLLDLSGCGNLERIGGGIISSLVGLEELKMLGSFNKWEAWDRKERENAGLRELESLINLRCLEIDIEDTALAAENMRLSSKLERFQIRIPPSSSFLLADEFCSYSSNKKLSLQWEGGTCVGDWIEMQLLRDAEYLHLTGNGANNMELAKSENIRWLDLGECETMKNIGRTSLMHNGTVFPHMEFLKLFSLPQLVQILDCPISSNSFQNLKELQFRSLPALKQFWKSNYVPVFANLSSIDISRCEMMEQVFLWNEEDDQNINNSESTITKMFPKLKKVMLYHLPNLTTFCQGIEGIEFPLLTTMSIEKCPKMTSIVSSNENISGGISNADIDDHHSLHLFGQPQKVSFGNLMELKTDRNPFCGHKIHVPFFIQLETLSIYSVYGGSTSLFTSSVAENLVNLIKLSICNCDEIVKVIKDEEEKAVSGGQRTLLFPNLQELTLHDLPKLVSFCEWKCDVELPSLRKVDVSESPKMKNFTLGFLAAPNLEAFKTDLDNYLEVSFHNLKQLTIQWNENPLYCYKIHVSLFKRLEVLAISNYKGSMSLFTTSTVENLVSLRELSISLCNEMVKVIEDEEEKEKEEEKLVISAAAQRTTILLFPKLQKLEMYSLRKLVSFCNWKCDLEFPSLREVEIWSCPYMKNFTLGLLTTPKLEVVRIKDEHFGSLKDLNGAVQQQFEKKQQESKESGTEVQEM